GSQEAHVGTRMRKIQVQVPPLLAIWYTAFASPASNGVRSVGHALALAVHLKLKNKATGSSPETY
ncbi:hypothetical protein NDU88_006613, partial [Pleurodeles waltl]